MSNEINFPSTVDQLRTLLLEAGHDPGAVASMKKGELKTRALELTTDKFELQLEALEDDSPVQTLGGAIGIKYGSKEWNDYIIGMLDDTEHKDGYPMVNGLARLIHILGDVISSKATQVIVTHGDTRCVTVNYEITIEWRLDTPIGFGNMTYIPQVRVFGGVADAEYDPSNTYMRHAAALAETKAYGRALRKALCLSVITADEMQTLGEEVVKPKASSAITGPLKAAICAKASALKLNLNKIMKEWNKGVDISVDDLTIQDGRDLFTHINSFQQEASKV